MRWATLTLLGALLGACDHPRMGEAIAPGASLRLTIDRASADFGRVGVGCSGAEEAFRVTNAGAAGSGPLAVQVPFGYAVVRDGCSGRSLAVGASCEVVLQLAPSVPGALDGPLVVRAGTAEAAAQLAGAGLHPAGFRAAPETVRFSPVALGTTGGPAAVVVSNLGGSPLPALEVTGASDAFLVTRDGCTGRTLGPGERCELEVRFRPQQMGAVTGALALRTVASACGGSAATVALEGDGMSAPALAMTPPPVRSQGLVATGCRSVGSPFVVTNIGDFVAGPLSVTVTGPFGVRRDDCSGRMLEPRATCDIVIGFDPVAVGNATGELVVRGIPGGEASAPLLGTGAESSVSGALWPASHDFGTIAPGRRSAGRTLAVTNFGAAAVGPLALSVLGAGAASFRVVDDTCARATLEPLASCGVTVVFEPSLAGSYAAQVSISSLGCGGGAATSSLMGRSAN